MKAPGECEGCGHVTKVYASGQHCDSCENPSLDGIAVSFSMAPSCHQLGYYQTLEQINQLSVAVGVAVRNADKMGQWAKPQALGVRRPAK